MDMARRRRVVYVGNIPFGATEEHVLNACELIGPVVSLRLMRDKETGKHKGYAFCEFKDEETALSALRNLQGYEMYGRRLRVNFGANKEDKGCAGAAAAAGSPSAFAMPGVDEVQGGVQSAGEARRLDALARYLASASREELMQLLSEMRYISEQDKELVRQLLEHNPPLASALQQAELMFGMAIQLQTTTQAPQVPQQPGSWVPQAPMTTTAPETPVSYSGQKRGPISDYNFEVTPGTEPSRPAKLPRMEDGHPTTWESDVMASAAPSTPAHVFNAEPTQNQAGNEEPLEFSSEVQARLLQQVADLSPEQLNCLPPEQREQVVQLRQMLRCGDEKRIAAYLTMPGGSSTVDVSLSARLLF